MEGAPAAGRAAPAPGGHASRRKAGWRGGSAGLRWGGADGTGPREAD
jgi:hypothetical protein